MDNMDLDRTYCEDSEQKTPKLVKVIPSITKGGLFTSAIETTLATRRATRQIKINKSDKLKQPVTQFITINPLQPPNKKHLHLTPQPPIPQFHCP